VSGGVRRYIEQKVAHMRRYRPGDCHVLVVPGERTGDSGDGTARTYTIASPLVSKTSRYRALLQLHLVEEVLERENPDIIESGDPYQLAWKAVASGRGLGIPVVGFYHSNFPEATLRSVAKYFGPVAVSIAEDIGQGYVKALYNCFERTLVPSPVLAGLLRSWGVENTTPVELGVDTDVFFPSDAPGVRLRNELRIPPGVRLLVYVGRLAPEKNVRVLFEAFRLLMRRGDTGGIHLLVVGDGTQRAALQHVADDTGAVSWLPYCPDPERLANIYRAADLFVHPGVQETFGLVALESQACGTPVIGIRGSYMDRIIFSDQLHWATENTPESLAEAIHAKLGENLRRTGLRASVEVRHRYAWKSVFERLFSIYDEVIADYTN
jgi:alpha-1,6-mannosyltransferase